MSSPSNPEHVSTPYTSLLPDGPEVPPHHPYMDNLYDVGPDKPLGYLPLRTIAEICGEDTQAVKVLSEQRGLTTLVQNEGEGFVASGALFVYDEIALDKLLQVNAAILQRRGWPTEPSDFVKRSQIETVDWKRESDLFTLIAWAYRDPRPNYLRPSVPEGEQPRVPKILARRNTWLGSLSLKK